MDYTSSRLQSHSVDEPSLEMPVLHTPAQFALGRGRVSRIPTPPASARNPVGEHLTALRKRRVSGQLSGAESGPDTDIEFRQGTGRQDVGFIPIPAGGRRRMAASFSGLGNYRPAADLVINGAQRGAGWIARVKLMLNQLKCLHLFSRHMLLMCMIACLVFVILAVLMRINPVESICVLLKHHSIHSNCADHNRWTETEQLSWLKNSLIKKHS